jgi:hypothetical protein
MRLQFQQKHTEVCFTHARERILSEPVLEVWCSRAEISKIAEQAGNWKLGQQLITNSPCGDNRVIIKGKNLERFKSLLV